MRNISFFESILTSLQESSIPFCKPESSNYHLRLQLSFNYNGENIYFPLVALSEERFCFLEMDPILKPIFDKEYPGFLSSLFQKEQHCFFFFIKSGPIASDIYDICSHSKNKNQLDMLRTIQHELKTDTTFLGWVPPFKKALVEPIFVICQHEDESLLFNMNNILFHISKKETLEEFHHVYKAKKMHSENTIQELKKEIHFFFEKENLPSSFQIYNLAPKFKFSGNNITDISSYIEMTFLSLQPLRIMHESYDKVTRNQLLQQTLQKTKHIFQFIQLAKKYDPYFFIYITHEEHISHAKIFLFKNQINFHMRLTLENQFHFRTPTKPTKHYYSFPEETIKDDLGKLIQSFRLQSLYWGSDIKNFAHILGKPVIEEYDDSLANVFQEWFTKKFIQPNTLPIITKKEQDDFCSFIQQKREEENYDKYFGKME